MKHKILSSLGGCLLFALLLLVFPLKGQAAEMVVTDDDNGIKVEYTLTAMEEADGYSAEVSFADKDSQPEELDIKSTVKGQNGISYNIKEVTSIEKNSNNSLTKINIAEGITSMDYKALKAFDNDSIAIQFPSTLESITGSDGFISWSKYPDAVDTPKWLSKMTPENGVVYAGKVAIYVPQAQSDADKVSEITFKDGCTQIAHKAMFGNKDVTKINIPASVKMIRGAAFDSCTNLSEVTFADNSQLEDLDWRVFYDCTALTAIKIPDSVTRIGTETFSGCTSLATIAISKESKLTKLEYGAFGYYPYRVDISAIRSNLYLGPRSNYGLRENAGAPIKKIYLPAAAVYSIEGEDAAGLFAGSKTLEEVTIGSSGETKASLPFEMFSGCTNLTMVNLNGNVDKINTGAFAECEKLTSINLDGVEKIQPYAFVKTGLKEVTIPSCVKSIASMAFGECLSLETMNLQSSLPEQNEETKMMQILGILSVHFNSQNSVIRSNEDFRRIYPKRTALKTLKIFKDSNGKNVIDGRREFVGHVSSLEEVVLPDGMTEIPDRTFHFCWSLKSVDMPESIQKIGNSAFQYDISLNIDFSKLTNLKEIGYSAFMLQGYADADGGIKQIILPDSVEKIDNYVFWGQANVTQVVIPESVKYIGYSAFHKLSSLKQLEIYASAAVEPGYYGGGLAGYSGFNSIFWNSSTWWDVKEGPASMKKLVLGKHFLKDGKIGESLFYESPMEEIDIQSDNIQNIGRAMFMKCKNLKAFTIPETVKTIEQGAFYETTSLKEMIIPSNIKTMDVETFRKSGVEKVWILSKDLTIKEPTTEDVTEEQSITKTQVTLYGDETVDDYLAIPKNIVIYGYAGSTAETYAKQHGNKFVSISKVTFDSQDGSKVSEKFAGNGEKLEKPENPTREGYTFEGWYTDKECTVAFDFDKDLIEKDITLYAKWEKKKETPASTPDEPAASTVEPVKKNMFITAQKGVYKVTKVTKSQTGTVQFNSAAKEQKAKVITIPNAITINGKKFKVTSIAPKAFARNKAVQKVIIGNNIKVIKKRTFYNAKNLKKVVIGTGVTTIESQAFGNLPKLEKVIVKSKKLKKVHKKAFHPLKRKIVIQIYKKTVAANNGTQKATQKNSTVDNHKIIIKVPGSKKASYERMFK